MSISHLSIQGVRNLTDVSIDLNPRYNFFIGPNGSGKTSLLEAIYLLGTARSFRTHLYHKVVQHDQPHLIVVGQLEESTIMGIQKEKDGETRIKINQLPCRQSALLAQHLPLQLYYPDSFKIIDACPKIRREILDWGVFHVKHDYFTLWAQYQRTLKQRNAWLRSGHAHRDNESPWDRGLSDYAEAIHIMRFTYFQQLLPIFNAIITDFFEEALILTYRKGWGHQEDDSNNEHPLLIDLHQDRERDIRMGYTHHGPHKADIAIQYQRRSVKDVFSRGQQKLVIIVLKLAQGILLSQLTGNACVYLLDDIFAEFDDYYLGKVMHYLSTMPGQFFFTGIHQHLFQSVAFYPEGNVFHVKHGSIVDP